MERLTERGRFRAKTVNGFRPNQKREINLNDKLISWNNWLKSKMILLVLLGLISGLLFPWLNGDLLEPMSMLAFGYMTFVVSLNNGIREFFHSLVHPGLLLICLLLVHGLVPVWAILWGQLFFPDQEMIRLGFLIAAGIPVGITSIIWTSISRGKTALALAVVTVDTIICPLFMPLYLRLVSGEAVQVDFLPLFVKLLLMITIPALIGMILKEWKGNKLNSFSKGLGGFTSKLALVVIIYFNAVEVLPYLERSWLLLKILGVVFLMVASGYFTGLLAFYFLSGSQKKQAAGMVFTIGMRNNSFGAILVMANFPPLAAVPVVLAMLFQQPLAGCSSYLCQRLADKMEKKQSTE